MMFPYPPFFTPRYRYPYPPSGFSPSRNKQPSKQNTTSSSKKYAENKKHGNNDKEKKSTTPSSQEGFFLDIFGLTLHFDDILLLCLIFFLYQEGVKDTSLFLVLILLLMN